MLLTLSDPEVLYWQDSMEYKPRFTALVKGIPPIPQVITTSIQDMSDETILGIEGVQAVCSDDILFAISFELFLMCVFNSQLTQSVPAAVTPSVTITITSPFESFNSLLSKAIP